MGQEPGDKCAAFKILPDSTSTAGTKSGRCYTNEFLLSFSELEYCKRKPDGIDLQVLRSVNEEGTSIAPPYTRGLIRKDRESDTAGESSQNLPEWRRASGSNWGENGAWSNYDRPGRQVSGNQGRWESRSSGSERESSRTRQDRDTPETDSVRRFQGPEHPGRQVASEHDGILGSGSGPRPLRSSGSSMLPNPRSHDRRGPSWGPHSNDVQNTHRSSKFTAHSRTQATDMFNDETFGNKEISNEERIEQEKKRRDTFEQERKEQHKLYEKQKLNSQKQNQHSAPKKVHDIFDQEENDESEDQSAILPLPDPTKLHSAKSGLPSGPQPMSTRPLVPPGFSKLMSAKQAPPKVMNSEVKTQADFMDIAKESNDSSKTELSFYDKPNHVRESQAIASYICRDKQETQTFSQDSSVCTVASTDIKPSSQERMQLPTLLTRNDQPASLSEIESEFWSPGLDNIIGFNSAREAGVKDEDGKERPGYIMNRLFGKGSVDSETSDTSDMNKAEGFGPGDKTTKSSKFARWFHNTEEEAGKENLESDASNILSLFAKKESTIDKENIVTISEDKTETGNALPGSINSIFPILSPGRVLPMPAGPSLEDIEKGMAASSDAVTHKNNSENQISVDKNTNFVDMKFSDKVSDYSKKADEHAVGSSLLSGEILTCEDLEQSIIAEATVNVSKLHISSRETDLQDARSFSNRAVDDDDSSPHNLLTLLQKGLKSKEKSSSVVQNSNDEVDQEKHKDHSSAPAEKSGAQTLELLFGKAFMNELRSTEAPPPVIQNVQSYEASIEGDSPFPDIVDKQNICRGSINSGENQFENFIGNSFERGAFESGSSSPFIDKLTLTSGFPMTENESMGAKLPFDGRPSFDDFHYGKGSYEDQYSRMHDQASSYLQGADTSAFDTRNSINGMAGDPQRPSVVTDSGQRTNSGGMDHFFGLPPKQNSHMSHHLPGAMDIPFNPHSAPGMNPRPPPSFLPFHHTVGHGNINMNINQMPHQPINMPHAPQGQQMNYFEHGNSLEMGHGNSESWPNKMLGRPFLTEPSGQMMYPPIHNGSTVNQPLYQSLQPHGFPPNHVLPSSAPQRGPPINNFPFHPEQLLHTPGGIHPNYTHPQGPLVPDVPAHPAQNPPIHLQHGFNSAASPPNQLLRPAYGGSRDFASQVDGRQHPGLMGNEGATIEMLFARELSRQGSGQGHMNQFPNRNMGFG